MQAYKTRVAPETKIGRVTPKTGVVPKIAGTQDEGNTQTTCLGVKGPSWD